MVSIAGYSGDVNLHSLVAGSTCLVYRSMCNQTTNRSATWSSTVPESVLDRFLVKQENTPSLSHVSEP